MNALKRDWMVWYVYISVILGVVSLVFVGAAAEAAKDDQSYECV